MAASYSIQDFVGKGVLRDVVDKLEADGWDDVPTLKMINAADMEALQLTDQQRVSFSFMGLSPSVEPYVLSYCMRTLFYASRKILACLKYMSAFEKR